MNTKTSIDVQTLRAACDQLVATAADPTTARTVLLQMWALGAAAADDLLGDLHHAAARHAARTGAEAGTAELLDALGRAQQASALRRAVRSGLADYQDAATAGLRAQAATAAARAAARLAQVDHHRRSARAGTTTATRAALSSYALLRRARDRPWQTAGDATVVTWQHSR